MQPKSLAKGDNLFAVIRVIAIMVKVFVGFRALDMEIQNHASQINCKPGNNATSVTLLTTCSGDGEKVTISL